MRRSSVLFCSVAAVGCAHVAPRELVDARAAYQRAATSVALQEAPAQLHTAENALQLAEQTFTNDGDNEHTRDLSYIALRKAELAETQGRVLKDQHTLKELETSTNQAQARELGELRAKSAAQTQELAASQAASADAQKRAAQATADLVRIATVTQDTRGTVITLSGEVLFTSGKSDLLAAAQAKLSQVATVLTQQDNVANIMVEGHTDTQGGEAYNLDLSTRRAQTVRDYLASHGVAADRIRAQGFGLSRPIADNKSAEGRANNRRVEIVVAGTPGTAPLATVGH